MEDEVLNLEFGVVALGEDEKGALFRSVNRTCNELFGEQALTRKLKNSIESIDADGRMAKISRVIIKNVGCVIGSVIEVDYFQPSDETFINQSNIAEDDEDDLETNSILGRRISMTFDMCDGSFYKYESLSKLIIEETGDYELEDLSLFDIVDNDCDEESDEFSEYIKKEASTLTIDDYFVVNTVKLILLNK